MTDSVRTTVEQGMARERGMNLEDFYALEETDLATYLEVTRRVYAHASDHPYITYALCPECRALTDDLDGRTCPTDGRRYELVTLHESDVTEVYMPGVSLS